MPKEPLPSLFTTIRNAIFGRHTLYVHPPIPDPVGYIDGTRKKVASFQLRTGEWIVFAKANAVGYGGNTKEVDTQLKLVGTEGTKAPKSDTAYASPSPLVGASMSLILAFQVDNVAQFELWAATQGGMAEIKDIVVTGIREV